MFIWGKRVTTKILIILALLITVAVTAGVWAANQKSQKSTKEKTAPNFTLSDLKGQKVSLKSVISKNEVVVLNFWATWCPPCRREIPELIAFQKKYAKKGATILAVALERDSQKVKSFARTHKINFPVLMDTGSKAGKLYQIYAIPTTYIIDKEGVIRDVIQGGTTLKAIESKVVKLLKEA